MELRPGTRIGTYEILSPLGSGAMGVVFRAVDTKLQRPVAIKFLPTQLADAGARQRFKREVETASSLNHPHILTVYDVGDFDAQPFLVSELVDGGTLQEWLRGDHRSWRQVVDLLVGVADGLAAAHAAGILHRDLKPANILVAKNGYGKLADFGLAKSLERANDDMATFVPNQTRPGMVVGTIAYMSPEQAAGKPLDARSDVFSFGVVLYEALTGRRPFGGTTDLELLQMIIHRPAEPLPDDLPVALRMIVEKALENDPGERYQSMREMVIDMRRLLRQKLPPPGVLTAAPTSRPWPLLLIVAVAAALAGAAVMAGASLLRSGDRAVGNPLDNALFTRFTNFEGTERSGVISPDGRFVAFRSDRDGPMDVWVGQVGTGRFVNLTKGIDDEFSTDTPSLGFSHDGSEIWLSGGAGRRLRLMPLMGGAPHPFLADASVSVSWSPDGSRVVYHLQDDGDSMYVADRTGANPRQIFRKPGEHNHFPIWSLDGRWIYFASGTPATKEMDVWRIVADGGTPERLTEQNSDVAYVTPIDARTVLYVAHDQDGSGPWLWSVDVERKSPHRVSFGVEKYASVAATPDARRLVATVANPSGSLWTVPILSDRVADESDVKAHPLPTADSSAPQFRGSVLFYLSSLGAGDGVWRFESEQSTEIWKGTDGSVLAPPAVSPDGRSVAIVIRRDGKLRLHVMSSEGGQVQAIADTVDVRGGASWSPDGRWIVVGGNQSGSLGLFKIPIDGGAPVRLASVAGSNPNPVWSPDGNLIVYAGPNVSIHAPLLAVQADGTPVRLPDIKVRRDGERVRFMPDGKALIYMQGVVRAQDFWLLDLSSMKARQLTRLKQRDSMRTFDVTPDGKRIVFDRLRDNSDIVLIDLPARNGGR
jgi:Tol biopolymer transport system component